MDRRLRAFAGVQIQQRWAECEPAPGAVAEAARACMIVTPSPMTAVSPMTTPVPWSISTPLRMVAAGWMSTASTSERRLCSDIAIALRFCRHSSFAKRYSWMAWYPLK